MDDKYVPFIVFESSQTRLEHINRRLFMLLILTVVIMFVSNALWLHAWTQYDYSGEDMEILVDGKDGIANYIGNSGVITNGEDSGQSEKTNEN